MKVLVIDDDPAMTELIKLLLSPSPFVVLAANDGQEGIDLARTEQPDIILLDLMMPEINGWQVCKRIRKFSQVPIIILSALDNPGLVANALDAGADDYLIKPVPNRVLTARIHKLVNRNKYFIPIEAINIER